MATHSGSDAALPDDPHLGQLRKQAKELRREHPDWPLAHAQLRIARRYGFTSWPALKRYVELVRSYRRAPDEVPEQADPAREFLRLACLTYGSDDADRWARAAQLLAAEPELGRDDVWVAAARCDVPALRRLLSADPNLASAQGGPFDWTPLAYLAYARHAPDVTVEATLGAATLLLDEGADPDTGYLWHGLPSPFTALTGVFGSGEGGDEQHPEHPHALALARLLLARGADANDAQALYNRMFQPDDRHLELLFEFGLGQGDGGPWKRRLGRAALTPEDMLLGQLAWAALHGFDHRIELLAAHGVDLDARLDDFGGGGRTAYAAALVAGHVRTADLLARLGARADGVTGVERVVASVLAGEPVDADAVTQAVAARPGLVAWAANLGDLAAVRRAVELGWPIDRLARTDVPIDQEWETGLHAAAGNGDQPMVRLLLELGADPEVRDQRFGSTPLGWAEHFDQPEVAAVLRTLSPSERDDVQVDGRDDGA